MSTAPHRRKILAHMFRRIIRNLDQIQNSSTAQAWVFDQSKIHVAKDAIHEVVEELEGERIAIDEWDGRCKTAFKALAIKKAPTR